MGYLIAGRYKRVYIFLNGISLKVNVIVWLEVELAYNNTTVQHVSLGTNMLSFRNVLTWLILV